MSTAKKKTTAHKTKQAIKRGIANEWRLIFRLPLITRLPIAWRIIRGR